MINYIHSYLNRPKTGWDPVAAIHAKNYNENESISIQEKKNAIDKYINIIGNVEGKKLLDLGGGPGHNSIIWAQKGAVVTWHDVSLNYKNITEQKAIENNLEIDFTIDYMDLALRTYGPNSFDVVFNRICWFYCMNDKSFASMFMKLLKPGGWAIIDNYIPQLYQKGWRFTLNRLFGIKIGHPFPCRGKIPSLFNFMAPTYIQSTFVPPDNEIILLKK